MVSPIQQAAPKDRAPYVAPVLQQLGDLRVLTLGGSAGVVDSLNINTLQN